MKQILLALLLSGPFALFAGEIKWELKKDKEGIRIYAGNIPNSNIKAVRAECVLQASLSELTALMLDARVREQWVYSVREAYVVKNISAQEQVYYSDMSMPWPMTDRDVVALLKITQHPVTKVLSAYITSAPGYIPEKKDRVRVSVLQVHWTVTAIGKGQIRIEYVAQADPGGMVPAWAVNMFCTKGPFESFKKLRTLLSSGAYDNRSFDFIVD